jgi:hypothetical protein
MSKENDNEGLHQERADEQDRNPHHQARLQGVFRRSGNDSVHFSDDEHPNLLGLLPVKPLSTGEQSSNLQPMIQEELEAALTASLLQQIEELQRALNKAHADVREWKEAWFHQREATGFMYWEGYRNGQKAPNKDGSK